PSADRCSAISVHPASLGRQDWANNRSFWPCRDTDRWHLSVTRQGREAKTAPLVTLAAMHVVDDAIRRTSARDLAAEPRCNLALRLVWLEQFQQGRAQAAKFCQVVR